MSSHPDERFGSSSRMGFNGQIHEAGSGWQLLGNGYRAYNPVLMRFHSPDSESPWGDGGISTYAYVLGDPVNRVDPAGHAPMLLQAIQAWDRMRTRIGAQVAARVSPQVMVGNATVASSIAGSVQRLASRAPGVMRVQSRVARQDNFDEGLWRATTLPLDRKTTTQAWVDGADSPEWKILQPDPTPVRSSGNDAGLDAPVGASAILESRSTQSLSSAGVRKSGLPGMSSATKEAGFHRKVSLPGSVTSTDSSLPPSPLLIRKIRKTSTSGSVASPAPIRPLGEW